MIAISCYDVTGATYWLTVERLMQHQTPRATILPWRRYVAIARDLTATAVSLVIWYMQFVFPTTTYYCTVHSDTPGSPPQRTTGWYHWDIHPPCPVACSTVQLITVARCPVSPSLYSRWLRLELTQMSESKPRVIAIRLVPDRRLFPAIWSRSNADRGKP